MNIVVWDVDPVLITVGKFSLRYYSALLFLSFMGGYVLLNRQITRAGGDVEEAGDFMVYGLPGILIGARLGHVLFYDLGKAMEDPAWILQVWRGGLASHGALIGLLVAMWLFTRRRAMPLLEGTDRLTFAGALAAILVRFGNLYNSEIVGKPTSGSWGFVFPRWPGGDEDLPRHPSQLYEIGLGVAVFALLLLADRALGRERRPRGAMTGIFLLAYFGGRFLVEFFKEVEGLSRDVWLNWGQILSVPCVIAGAIILRRSLVRRDPAAWPA